MFPPYVKLRRPFLFLVFSLSTVLGIAQPVAKRAMYHADVDAWKTIENESLSPDGRFLTYTLQPRQGDSEVVLVQTSTEEAWTALEAAFPNVPFTWVDLARGGHGVFVMTAQEWQEYGESFL